MKRESWAPPSSGAWGVGYCFRRHREGVWRRQRNLHGLKTILHGPISESCLSCQDSWRAWRFRQAHLATSICQPVWWRWPRSRGCMQCSRRTTRTGRGQHRPALAEHNAASVLARGLAGLRSGCLRRWRGTERNHSLQFIQPIRNAPQICDDERVSIPGIDAYGGVGQVDLFHYILECVPWHVERVILHDNSLPSFD